MKKLRGYLLIGSLVSLCLLTGCWDQMELNERAIWVASGFDLAPNGSIEVSGQILIPSKLGSAQSISGQRGAGKGFFVASSIGKDVSDAVNNLQSKLSRQVFASHRRVIVVGEDFARKGIASMLDEHSRNTEVRLRSDLLVVLDSTAKEFFRTIYPLEINPAFGVWKEHEQFHGTRQTSFLDFLMTANSKGVTPTLPIISRIPDLAGDKKASKDNEGFQMSGTAIFNREFKMIGFLNVHEGVLLNWILGRLKNNVVTGFVPEGNGFASLFLSKVGGTITPVLKGDKLSFIITLSGQGTIRENNTSLDLKNQDSLKKVEQAINSQVKEEVITLVNKVQRKYGEDVFGFGEAVHRKYPYLWKRWQTDWMKRFTEVNVTVNSTLRAERIGSNGSPLHLIEGGSKQ